MQLSESLAPLRSRNFRIYWVGQAISLVGTWMQQMAQGWVVTRLTSNASALGLLAVTTSLPMVMLGLKGGQVADRYSKRNILLVTQLVLALLALTLGLLAMSGLLTIWHVFVLTVLLGLATAFDFPAAQAFVPELVDTPLIARAVALMQAIFHGSRFVGPTVAGLLIARFGEASAFFVNSASFLAVIASLLVIPAAARVAPPRGGGDKSLGAGIRYVRNEPVARALIALLILAMTLAFPFIIVLMVYYARHVVSAGAAGMGSLMSASGFGAVTGALIMVATGLTTWQRRLWTGLGMASLAMIGMSLNRTLVVAIGLNGCLALGTSLYVGTITQVIQQRVPDELRGRVMALFGIGFTSVMPLSSFLLSLAADFVGLPRLMAACALTLFTLGAIVLVRLRAASVAQAG